MRDPVRLYDKLCELVVAENMAELSIHDIFSLLKRGMELVEEMKAFTGVQKKQMVIEAIEKIINTKVVDNPIMKHALLTLLEPSIDTIIEVSKQEWMINLKKSTSRCCPFL